jgi:hypothetical protein
MNVEEAKQKGLGRLPVMTSSPVALKTKTTREITVKQYGEKKKKIHKAYMSR